MQRRKMNLTNIKKWSTEFNSFFHATIYRTFLKRSFPSLIQIFILHESREELCIYGNLLIFAWAFGLTFQLRNSFINIIYYAAWQRNVHDLCMTTLSCTSCLQDRSTSTCSKTRLLPTHNTIPPFWTRNPLPRLLLQFLPLFTQNYEKKMNTGTTQL